MDLIDYRWFGWEPESCYVVNGCDEFIGKRLSYRDHFNVNGN